MNITYMTSIHMHITRQALAGMAAAAASTNILLFKLSPTGKVEWASPFGEGTGSYGRGRECAGVRVGASLISSRARPCPSTTVPLPCKGIDSSPRPPVHAHQHKPKPTQNHPVSSVQLNAELGLLYLTGAYTSLQGNDEVDVCECSLACMGDWWREGKGRGTDFYFLLDGMGLNPDAQSLLHTPGLLVSSHNHR